MKFYPSVKKSMFTLSMLFLFTLPQSYAQQQPLKRSHAISVPTSQISDVPTTGTLDVIAIMVEFQPDSNRLTSGTGVFGPDGMDGLPYLTNEEDTRIDPLPHNRAYFEAHLDFARNYFEKSSDGQLTIDYHVLPEVIQLDSKMEEYSPTGETFTLEKIAQFQRDAWQKAEDENLFGDFDFTGMTPENTAFIIFHAGIGRDVELTGTSLDITPFDIPSIYLRKNDLQDLLEAPSFNGFPIGDGSFRVTNSMIIPRTESRRGEDIQDNEIVFPLSINGLLCASIGSHLGLPDLFNTETGEPAIGRFGLMDGAGFFSYNGLIPPEPSAWEKIYLDWETPISITDDTDLVELPAAALDQPGSIVKYELSSTEYFLAENRNRDPENNGVRITIRKPDSNDEISQVFTNEDSEFIFQESGFDTLLQAGTFVDVSNFDWSLPGGLDVGEDGDEGTEDDVELNGGILIWHIDEALINQQLSASRVNADPDRRGVDLEEADGAQDIGKDAGLLDNSPSFGFPYDFWWEGNNYRVITENGEEKFYANRFGPDTRPNNNSNSGAKSFFEFYDFSDDSAYMTFRIRPVESTELFEPAASYQSSINSFHTPEGDYWDYFPLSLHIATFPFDTVLIAPSSNGLTRFDITGTISQDSTLTSTAFITQPVTIPVNGNNLLASFIESDGNTSTFLLRILPETGISTIRDYPVGIEQGFLSSQNGDSVFLDFTNRAIIPSSAEEVSKNSSFQFRSEIVDGAYTGINNGLVTSEGEIIDSYTDDKRLFSGTITSNQGRFYYLFDEEEFKLINPNLEDPLITIFQEEKAEWPAIINEGYIFRINRTDNQIEGYNFNGALLANTPILAPDDIQFIGTPLIADINSDGEQEILVVGQDDYSMNIFAFDTDGIELPGFPLYVGGAVSRQTQPVHPVLFDNNLYAISHYGDLRIWNFPDMGDIQWPSRYGPNRFNKVSAYIEFTEDNETGFSVLNTSETYNWPNPADDKTNIRFQVEKPGGSVEITIIDLTGRIIYEETFEARGGAPEEFSISTRQWGSGAYFAMVKATVEGRSESKLIKIGVAH